MEAIHNRDDAHLPCRVQHTFERSETFGTVTLEHGRLEFNGSGTAIGRLKHTHGIQFGAQCVDVVAPISEKFSMGIDAHA